MNRRLLHRNRQRNQTFTLLFLLPLSVCLFIAPLFPPHAVLLAAAQTTQDSKEEAEKLLQIGVQQYRQNNLSEALETFQQALVLFQKLGDRKSEGTTLNIISGIHVILKQYPQALTSYQQALEISRETGNRMSEGSILDTIGFIHDKLRQYPQALAFHQKALAVFTDIGNRKSRGTTLRSIGAIHFKQANYLKALEFYQQALSAARENSERKVEGDTSMIIGSIYVLLGQYSQSLLSYRQALEISKEVGDRSGEGSILNAIGIIHERIGHYPQALASYQKALVIFTEVGDRRREGTTLNSIGNVYSKLGQSFKSLKFYQKSLAIYKEVSDRAGEGISLGGIGVIYARLGNHPRALEFSQQALAIHKATGNRRMESYTLVDIGKIYSTLGQSFRSLELYQQALVISKAIGDRPSEGNALNSIGSIYSTLGNSSRALEFYQQALEIRKETRDRSGESTTLNNIGSIYSSLGQYPKALEFYQQALTIAKAIGGRFEESATLNNIGSIYSSLGQYPKALEFYQQALTIAKAIGGRSEESITLNNIGIIYSSLGQYPKALEFYQQALAIAKEIGDRSGEATCLINIGLRYAELGQYPKALEFYQQALAIAKEIGGRETEGTTLNNIGAVYNSLGQYPKALEFYQQALTVYKIIDRAGEGTTLNNIGVTYDNLRQYAKALEFYQQALAIHKEIGKRPSEGTTLHNIGGSLKAQKQPELAIVFLKRSVSTYESIREELRVLPKEQQQSYTDTVANTYRRLADVLLQQDRVLEAQQVLDLLKVQELEGYLRNVRGDGKKLEYLRPEDEILQQYNELQKTAIEVGKELTELRKLDVKNSLNSTQKQRLPQLVELERKINRQFNEFIESKVVQDLVKQLSLTASKQNLNLEDLNALRDDLRKLDAVLIYPLILEDRLELVITTPNSPPLRRTVTNLKREELNRVIAEYRSALEKPGSNAQALAQKLYTWLIKPLEADLQQAQPKTIIYAPDGQLRYIPLAALHDGKQWLIQRYRINNITARSVTDFHTVPQKQPRILAGAFGQVAATVKVGDQSFQFAGLPAASREVKTLVAAIPGTLGLLDRDFSRAATLQRLNSFNIVHLATHGKFVVGRAENSFILFGNNQADVVTLDEVKDLTMTNVDLVVLSACETGLGGKLGNGEEILGLGYQFQRAGARATIASLWQVDDGGTQVMMNAFYAALKQGMSKAQALQEAQKALITGNYSTVGGKRAEIEVIDTRTGKPRTIDSDTLNHPYYWAPFILIGNGL